MPFNNEQQSPTILENRSIWTQITIDSKNRTVFNNPGKAWMCGTFSIPLYTF